MPCPSAHRNALATWAEPGAVHVPCTAPVDMDRRYSLLPAYTAREPVDKPSGVPDTAPPSDRCQDTDPNAASTAYTYPSSHPTYTVPCPPGRLPVDTEDRSGEERT